MNRLDAEKDALVARYVALGAPARCSTSAAPSGRSSQRLRAAATASRVAGRGLQGSVVAARSLAGVEFHCGLVLRAAARGRRSTWSRCGTSSSTTTIRCAVSRRRGAAEAGRHGSIIEVPRLDSRTFGWFGDRWPGLQAPQHTVALRSRAPARASSSAPGSRSSTTCHTARSRRTSISSPARRSGC